VVVVVDSVVVDVFAVAVAEPFCLKLASVVNTQDNLLGCNSSNER
jgi:hypothetical protein